ncbi:E3 ubiquitin-protein ligase RNF213-like [Saccopteryx leptura]|uniref:E3 ubiquitin-protein ligase RNF213-like n=1 Tax=Saccopteryx leptura TaxID=249018 RepID=UPI00339CAD60
MEQSWFPISGPAGTCKRTLDIKTHKRFVVVMTALCECKEEASGMFTRFHEVKDYIQDYIQDYLSRLEKKAFIGEEKTELNILVSRCLEEMARIRVCLDRASEVLQSSGRARASSPSAPFFSSAQTPLTEKSGKCGRLVLRVTLAPFPSKMVKEKQQFLQQVKHFCARVQNDGYRVCLVRKLTGLQGKSLYSLCPGPDIRPSGCFPRKSLHSRQLPATRYPHRPAMINSVFLGLQKDSPGQMDRYVVHGEEDEAVRDAVGKVILECKPLAFVTVLEACRSSQTPQAVYLLLALFREVTALHQSCNASLHPKPETASLPSKPEDLQAQATNWQGLEHVRCVSQWSPVLCRREKTQTELRLAMCWEARPPAPNQKFLTNSCPVVFLFVRLLTHSPGHASGSGAQPADGPLPRPELRNHTGDRRPPWQCLPGTRRDSSGKKT